MCLHVQSCQLVHSSHVRCTLSHGYILYKQLYAKLYFTVQYSIEYSSVVLLFQAQDLNIEWSTKVAAAIQNAIQYNVIYEMKIRATTQTSLDLFFFFSKRQLELNAARNQNLCHQCQALVKLKLTHHLLLLMILQFYYLPPSHPPPVSNPSCLLT